LIESIYIDVAGDRSASRYTLLVEKLHAATAAKRVHDAMARRVSLLHDKHIEKVRLELEAEGERLRKAIQVSKARA